NGFNLAGSSGKRALDLYLQSRVLDATKEKRAAVAPLRPWCFSKWGARRAQREGPMTEDEGRGRVGAADGGVRPGAEPRGRGERGAREVLWMAAHGRSAPLAAIRMHAGARERGGLCVEDARAALARVERLAASAQRLVDDVLAVERLEERPRGPGAAEI